MYTYLLTLVYIVRYNKSYLREKQQKELCKIAILLGFQMPIELDCCTMRSACFNAWFKIKAELSCNIILHLLGRVFQFHFSPCDVNVFKPAALSISSYLIVMEQTIRQRTYFPGHIIIYLNTSIILRFAYSSLQINVTR